VISRRNRFHGHRSVSRVRGSLVHSTHLSLRFAANKKNDYRCAVVVSKKVDGRAVVRNRIRRRIFESIRTQKQLEGTAIDVVVYVKNSNTASMSFKDLESEISNLTRQALAKTLL